jgi:ADP-ribose pyrophosphatase YjhB (NUDIX family)
MTAPRGDRAAVFILRDRKILLVHRLRHGSAYDAVPGGTIEENESPGRAAVREILEETGLRVALAGPVLVLRNEGRTEFYFDAEQVEGEPVLGGPEARRHSPGNRYELGWVDLERIGSRPILPSSLRAWMTERDWGSVPGGATPSPPGP